MKWLQNLEKNLKRHLILIILNNMKLKKFIKKFVEPNTIIKLWYKTPSGHEPVEGDSWKMEWEFLRDNEFYDYKVIGVTDILLINSPYTESVNIVVENIKLADKYIGIVNGNLGLIFELMEDEKYYSTSSLIALTRKDIRYDLKRGYIKPYIH
jgi:hypothetical protein